MRRSTPVLILLTAVSGCVVSFEEWPLVEDGAGSGGMNAGGKSSGGKSSGGEGAASGEAGQAGAASCEPGAAEGCWEQPDGSAFASPQPAVLLAPCQLGERLCDDGGVWGPCLGAVAPAASDACEPDDDANCNGTPNEGCPCSGSEMRACGSDVGNCQAGTQTCSNEVWGTCEGAIGPAAADTCDQDDDANCNDVVNEDCDCINGTTEPCQVGEPNCVTGTRTCVNGVFVDDGNEAPNAPSSPDPTDGEADVAQVSIISWSADDPDGDTLTYDVYLSKSNPPTTLEASDLDTNQLLVTTLDILSTYYWQVVAKDGQQTTAGPVWSFSTVESAVPNNPPIVPGYPQPPSSVGGVPLDVDLGWWTADIDSDAVTSIIYFDTQNPPTALLAAVPGQTTYALPTLEYGTTYYWKVVASDTKDESEGPVWSFTTAPGPIATWEVLGSTGFSTGNVWYVSLDATSGPLFAAFTHASNSMSNVMRFNGSSWDQVGPANFTSGTHPILASYGGVPYVTLSGGGVMRFVSNAWESIGGPGSQWSDIKFLNGTPYVSYSNNGGGTGFASLQRYDGVSWELVGNDGFSNTVAWFTELAFNGTTPYVAFNEHADGGHVSVMSFDGVAWDYVGNSRISELPGILQPQWLDLEIVGGVPYVAFADGNDTYVMRYTGGAWEFVGDQPVGYGSYPRFTLFNGELVMAFADTRTPDPCCRISVLKHNGTRWEYVGGFYASDGDADYPAVTADASHIYVGYRDETDGGRITVKRF